ncbi:glycosyltransferase family 4 protein [Yeosuana marina]|uniref:glycosyltransferase family 4 protein n=1 Tax=Yeosuana marina TaxID=1565536 RepID=UPI0030C891A5
MILLYITNQICGAAGLERVLSIKTNYLVEKYDYSIHIITLNQNNEPPFYTFNPKIKHHDIKVTGNSLQYIKEYIFGIKRVVKQIKPNVISVCDDGLKGFFLPLLLSKPCPMIYERHVSKNIEFTEEKVSFINNLKTKLTYRLMHAGAKHFHKFIVLTKDNINEWQLNNIQVISNPLSFYPNESSKLNDKVVLAVGRQSYQKGYDRLLKSWKKVSLKHPDWVLHIYGKFDTALMLENLAMELGVSKSVCFFPPVKDIVQVYLKASIYVMSSRFEGFGMVLTEAMSCGLPVISYDCPCGPKDIITNKVNGLLIKNNDIDAFSSAINNLIENESLRLNMGIMAKESVKKYLPDQIVPQWNKLFKTLIS